jgi:hypothetical protein
MDDRKLLALARKNAAKAQEQAKPKRSYDPTLDATRPSGAEDNSDAERIFREMKRRES